MWFDRKSKIIGEIDRHGVHFLDGDLEHTVLADGHATLLSGLLLDVLESVTMQHRHVHIDPFLLKQSALS